MHDSFWSTALRFFSFALTSGAAQNLLLTRLVGGDHVFRMGTPREERFFSVSQTLLAVISSAGFWWLDTRILPGVSVLERFGLSPYYARAYLWPLASALVIGVVYYTAYVAVRGIGFLKEEELTASRIPLVGFNSLVCTILFRIAANDYTFLRAMAFAVGSSVGYHFALLLIWEGRKKMEESDLPEAFSGLPALLLYIAGLAMAIYALAGHGVATMM